MEQQENTMSVEQFFGMQAQAAESLQTLKLKQDNIIHELNINWRNYAGKLLAEVKRLEDEIEKMKAKKKGK